MPDPSDVESKLALLAHDLRTPLTAMRLTADLIGTEALSITQQDHLQVLTRAIDALTRMTSELVDAAARVQNDRDTNRVSVSSILHDQADLFRAAAAQKGLELKAELEDMGTGWHVERSGNLSRAVATLLDNAIKYTEHGSVTLRATPCVSGANVNRTLFQISVQDTGPGIDDGEAERIFRAFERGSAGQSGTAGTGLGLWGASDLLREMGGELRVFPGADGGSRFVITLPVQRDIDQLPEGEAEETEPALKALPTGPLSARVLVVDDNHTNRHLLAALLESFGVTSVEASSGEEAFEILKTDRFDAVLLDLYMPGMNGTECAEAWQSAFGTDLPPIVAVTAGVETIDAAELKAGGIHEILAKPLSPVELYRVLSGIAPERS